MKRIVICCDGTWNELDFTVRPVTNVVKLAQSIHAHGRGRRGRSIQQIVFYDEGVGTLEGESLDGGGFADGLEQNIVDAYTFLVFNYDPGDEIYVFGFSRGAYTARSLVGMIRNVGIMQRDQAPWIPEAFRLYQNKDIHPDDLEAREFRARHGYPGWWVSRDALDEHGHSTTIPNLSASTRHTIKYLGVWDTVGSRGVPGVFNAVAGREEDHGFHDVKLSSMVEHARHAVAIDENRQVFRPCLWERNKILKLNNNRQGPDTRYQQKWFPGDHGSVGGGGDITGLSDIALQWVAEGAMIHGADLHYDTEFHAVNFPLYTEKEIEKKKHAEPSAKVVYAPTREAPLSNISKTYKRVRGSAFSRLLNFMMKGARQDRMCHLQSVHDIHPEAKAYAGFNGENTSYKEDLIKRIRAYQDVNDSYIQSAFPGWSP